MASRKPTAFGVNVLIITTRKEAIKAGASPVTAHHRSSPECQFWWPEMRREVLEGRRFDMIVAAAPLSTEMSAWIKAFCCRGGTIFVTGQLGGLSSALGTAGRS